MGPRTIPRVFISHNSKDKEFVRRLAKDLDDAKVGVWVDERELKVGDSIVQGVNDGLKESDYVAVVLSQNSIQSNWVQAELNAALMDQLSNQGTTVLPILLDDCELPPLLRDRIFADFRGDYAKGLKSLLDVFEQETIPASPMRGAGAQAVGGMRGAFGGAGGAERAAPAREPDCPTALGQLKIADLRRRLNKRASRDEVGTFWFDLFETPMGDDMGQRTKNECIIQLLARSKNRDVLDDLIVAICEERPDLAKALTK